jgi:hypothetical protein
MFEFKCAKRTTDARLKAMLNSARAKLLEAYNAITGSPAGDVATYEGTHNGASVTVPQSVHGINDICNAGCAIICGDTANTTVAPHHPGVTINDDGSVTFQALNPAGNVSTATGLTIQYWIGGI